MDLKRKSSHLAPKVVIDPPFERSWKNKSWKRVPQAGTRVEETVTELILELGKFLPIIVGSDAWWVECGQNFRDGIQIANLSEQLPK